MYDICIIGGGPAGLTAALYSLRAGRTTVLLEEKMFGGQMAETSVIENMPGSPDAEGWELTMRFAEQVNALGVETVYESAKTLAQIPDGFSIQTDRGREILSKKVILAMGVKRKRLGVPGEDRFSGKGVSWCAVCDGAFFRKKSVAVVGGGNTALEDALYLSNLCEKVYLLVRKNRFRGQEVLAGQVREKANIEVLWETEVQEILGEATVSGVTVSQKGEARQLAVSGVFIAIGLSPAPALYEHLVETTPEGYIVAGEDCRTGVPGLFAAGDIRKKEIRQIVTALGDGATAAELAGRELRG